MHLDANEVAVRAALLLNAPGAAVVCRGEILGSHGLGSKGLSDLQHWLDLDPDAARAWSGSLRRVARTTWPGTEAEIWVFGTGVRRLPGGAYAALHGFMLELAA